MLPEETFPLQNAAARSSFWAVGATGPRRCAAELAQEAWLGTGRRTSSRAQSGLPTKENSWGLGFGRWRPPAMQQGPGSPASLCAMESVGPGAKKACVAFWIPGALGLLFAARGDFPFAECSCQKLVLGRRCYGASALSSRAGSGDMAGAWAQKAFARPILLPHQGEPLGSGFQWPETTSKAAGPREPGAAPPSLAHLRAEGGGENG